MCRGVGDQRRENSERGRAKDHRPALLPTQPPVVVSCVVSLWELLQFQMKIRFCVGIIFCIYLSLKLKLSKRHNGSSFFVIYSMISCMVTHIQSSSVQVVQTNSLHITDKERGDKETWCPPVAEPQGSLAFTLCLWRRAAPASTILKMLDVLHLESGSNGVFYKIFFLIHCLP